jgi:hypothetical protein
MLGIPPRRHMHHPKHYEDTCSSGSDGYGRDRDRLFAEFFRQRQGRIFDGSHPGLGRMGGHQPGFMGGRGMSPMMGGYPRQGYSSPMGMGIGMHPGMGGMPPGMGSGYGIGMGMGLGISPTRSPLGHSPFGRQRHSPFRFNSLGPPRAHSMSSPHRHGYSPYSGPLPFPTPRYNPFQHPIMYDDDMDSDYDMSRRRGYPRRGMGRDRYSNRYPNTRRLRPSMYDDSDDEFDECEDWDDEFDDEDEFEAYVPRRQRYPRWRGY